MPTCTQSLRSLATKPNLLFPFSSKSSTVSQNQSPIFCPVINYKLFEYSESITEKTSATTSVQTEEEMDNHLPGKVQTANPGSSAVMRCLPRSQVNSLKPTGASHTANCKGPDNLNWTFLVMPEFLFILMLFSPDFSTPSTFF